LTQALLIGGFGAAGALLRFWLSTAVYGVFGRAFPYGTLTVNILGCLAMGVLYVLLVERASMGPEWRAALLIGLLGGFTTFSTFTIETFSLVEQGLWLRAAANVALSVVTCLFATWAGVTAARLL
jgi:fluoride exporter